MKFWFRKHHYRTQIRHTLKGFTQWWNVKGFVRAVWHGEDYLTWFGHEDDCCDYWQPVDLDDPATKRAFMLDDELSLTPITPEVEE